MKHLLSSILLIFVTVVTAFATGQITERINENGIDKGLAGRLLELDDSSFPKLKERIPAGMVSTALWRGYIGHWKIKNDSLFLDSVLVSDNSSDTLRFIPAVIDDIYAARRTPSGYFADWVTDTLRIVSGDIVRYVHMGWASDWENEEFVTVEGGLVKDRTVYKNRAINRVSDGDVRKVIDSLNLGFIPKRIVLQLGYSGFDEKGTPTGYEVKVVRSCGDTVIDDKVVHSFSDSTVLRRFIPIYYIRGRYKSQELTVPVPASHNSGSTSN